MFEVTVTIALEMPKNLDINHLNLWSPVVIIVNKEILSSHIL